MSSRDGTIIPYHTWRDDAIQQAQILLEWREIAEKEVVARKVAFAALKFSMLLQDTYKKIRLDMDKSLSFEWETGPYLQYTYARIASLLRKQWSSEDTYIDGLETQAEHDVLITLSQFGHTIQQAVNDRKPSIIARYTLELCRQFNSYYSTTTIISDDKKNTAARIQLVRATQQVLHNGLALLWIDTLEKM
jgi:arginyl-tRNA synthetase